MPEETRTARDETREPKRRRRSEADGDTDRLAELRDGLRELIDHPTAAAPAAPALPSAPAAPPAGRRGRDGDRDRGEKP